MAWHAALNGDRIEITGELSADDAPALWSTLRTLTRSPGARLDLELTHVDKIDARTLALVIGVRPSLRARGIEGQVIASETLRPRVALFGGERERPPLKPQAPRVRLLARVGMACEDAWRRLQAPVSFIGELVDGTIEIIRSPRRANWPSLPGLVERAGADAILIVILLDFLVGFVIALQATPQLRMLGANPYVADLVGIAVTRELAPLMTAIIIAGRSGAGFAAELGTMHVSDEIDALEVMGISPIAYLVFPRVLALALVAPVLVLLGDVAGVLGGLVVGVISLDLTTQGFLIELQTILLPSDVWTGIVKGVAFAIAIGIIGCHEGLAARGAAAGVGRRTTATVVLSLFTVVVIDALLTMFFRAVGV